jgi:hypothetical protein
VALDVDELREERRPVRRRDGVAVDAHGDLVARVGRRDVAREDVVERRLAAERRQLAPARQVHVHGHDAQGLGRADELEAAAVEVADLRGARVSHPATCPDGRRAARGRGDDGRGTRFGGAFAAS